MTLLAGTLYDPSTLATKATSAALAMTALDTTNLRLSFTVPANGAVLVRLRGTLEGGTTAPGVLLGVLEGSTVRGRTWAFGAFLGSAATSRAGLESLFVVPGLTPAANLTWDAAYGVQTATSGTSLRYGGPNDTTTDNANGGFAFEIHDCPNLLAAKLYDPTTAASISTASLLVMTVIDTTNLRITFTAPASGKVLVRLRTLVAGSTTAPQVLLGILDGATIRARVTAAGNISGSLATGAPALLDATFVITGLTPSTSYTWDAAYGVEVLVASTGIKYGGPNTTALAYGAFQYEIWAV